jgi:glycosyltransferase involved in cell wall biosynthesis
VKKERLRRRRNLARNLGCLIGVRGEAPLRILILKAVGYISRMGGTSERVLQIATELADQGIEVSLSGVVETDLKALNSANLKLIAKPQRIGELPRVLVWFTRLLAEGRRADIVQMESFDFDSFKNYSFSFISCLALFLPLRLFKAKFLMVFHEIPCIQDPRKSVSGKLNLLLQKILLTLFDASIAPGLSIKKWFEEMHGKLGGKIVVIPNGAPDLTIGGAFDNLRLREKYNVGSNALLALFFGSMDFKPNYEAASGLYNVSNLISRKFEEETGKNLAFIVAGKHSEILPKSDCFIPLGFVKELDELLSLPDVIVLPHLPSTSGPHVKTMYAFLSKKPVIATDDAVKDMPGVIPREHFLPFDIEDPITLLDCLTELYYDRRICDSLTLNAYLYAQKFSWKAVSLMHIKLYEQLLLNKRLKSSPNQDLRLLR